MKKGFTLTEIMIALAVIAILTVVLMPIIFKLRPNQEVLMTKRAYYMTQTIISEMINNEKCYPFVYDRVGFEDEREYSCSQTGTATEKFQKLFREYANARNVSDNNFYTKDGMKWTFGGSFTNNSGNSSTSITVDTDPAREHEHDTFTMTIHANGKIDITGANAEWAKAAIQTDRKLTGE